MTLNTTMEPAADSQPRTANGIPLGKPVRRPGFVEPWLHAHLTKVALAIIAAGFGVRIAEASRTYFNPDEVLHYLLINEPSLFLAYKASLTTAHPPLVYFLLYLFHFLGRSELALRLPLVLAGTASCWFIFKWIQALFGSSAGLIALITAAFSPPLITLSAEVREYALLLFCMAAALYFLERAFAEKSASTMWWFSLCLYLTILSHYSAAFFALALGVYALAKIADGEYPRKMVNAWAFGQVGALAIYFFLYLTHISRIRNNLAIWALSFGDTFFQPSQESIFHFTRENTWNIFQYLFAQPYVTAAVLISFIAGAGFLFFREFMSAPRNQAPRHVGIQLLLPFAAVWAAAIAGIYPYVGSRHTIILAPLVIAAASFSFAAVCRHKLWAAALLATLLMAISNVYGTPSEPGIAKANQSRELMASAVSYMQQAIPEGDLILADQESSLSLAHYYCRSDNSFFMSWSRTNFDRFSCKGHLIVTLRFWYLRPEGLAAPFENLVHRRELQPGDRVWIFQAGWGGHLIAGLPQRLPQFRCITPKTFGENITIVSVMVGPDLSPAPLEKCPD